MTTAMTGRARPTSERLMARARRSLPGGVDSNVRLDGSGVLFARGEGAWLWDVDGNDYVDHLLGQGPAFLGMHRAPSSTRSTRPCAVGWSTEPSIPSRSRPRSRSSPSCAGPRWCGSARQGRRWCRRPCAWRVPRPGERVIRFEGHYHGWLDNVLVAPGAGDRSRLQPASSRPRCRSSSCCRGTTSRPWPRLERHGDEVAAVIMEPMMINAGAIEPGPGYLEGVRDLCDRHGCVLVFDEIITGFRIALGGASERYGVTPDLATYGKAMAGSWPVAALAGKAELMELFGTGEVTHAGTFNANVMGMAAVSATLRILEGTRPYERLEAVGGSLVAELRDSAPTSVPLHVQGLPMAFHVAVRRGGRDRLPEPVEVRRASLPVARGPTRGPWRLGRSAGHLVRLGGPWRAGGRGRTRTDRRGAVLRTELVASRTRILEAADEQRRQVVRDLHDGAQQRLVEAIMTLQVAQARGEGTALVTEAVEQVRAAIAELRELARGIHPSILTHRGLEAAVEALTHRMPLPVDVEMPNNRYPPSVESAAYFVVAEALTNVAKYASAKTARVMARASDDCLILTIEDDGVGGARPSAGSGLGGLHDRITALSGTLTVESSQGSGTRIRAEIPLP